MCCDKKFCRVALKKVFDSNERLKFIDVLMQNEQAANLYCVGGLSCDDTPS